MVSWRSTAARIVRSACGYGPHHDERPTSIGRRVHGPTELRLARCVVCDHRRVRMGTAVGGSRVLRPRASVVDPGAAAALPNALRLLAKVDRAGRADPLLGLIGATGGAQ